MGGKGSPCIVTFNHGTMGLDTGGEERRVDSRNQIYYYDCKLVRLIWYWTINDLHRDLCLGLLESMHEVRF